MNIKYLFVGLIFITFLASCAGLTSRTNSGENSFEPFLHQVKYRGETLGLISSWYTGSSRNWEKILVLNPGLRPEKIKLGDEILIPKALLKKRKPFTKSFVASRKKSISRSKSNKKISTSLKNSAAIDTNQVTEASKVPGLTESSSPKKIDTENPSELATEGQGEVNLGEVSEKERLLNELLKN